MKIKIKNRLLSGNLVVAELPPTLPRCRRWLAIYPVAIDALLQKKHLLREIRGEIFANKRDKWCFRIIVFDIESEYIENGWDVSQDEMIDRSSIIIFGFDNLVGEIEQLGVDCKDLLEPWKTDYPL